MFSWNHFFFVYLKLAGNFFFFLKFFQKKINKTGMEHNGTEVFVKLMSNDGL